MASLVSWPPVFRLQIHSQHGSHRSFLRVSFYPARIYKPLPINLRQRPNSSTCLPRIYVQSHLAALSPFPLLHSSYRKPLPSVKIQEPSNSQTLQKAQSSTLHLTTTFYLYRRSQLRSNFPQETFPEPWNMVDCTLLSTQSPLFQRRILLHPLPWGMQGLRQEWRPSPTPSPLMLG